MMTNPALARRFRDLAEQTSEIARKRGLDPQKQFSNLGEGQVIPQKDVKIPHPLALDR